jgi:hypothetical protein
MKSHARPFLDRYAVAVAIAAPGTGRSESAGVGLLVIVIAARCRLGLQRAQHRQLLQILGPAGGFLGANEKGEACQSTSPARVESVSRLVACRPVASRSKLTGPLRVRSSAARKCRA